MSDYAATLTDANGALVSAIVRDYLTLAEIDAVENVWYPYLVAATQTLLQSGVPVQQLPERKHWLWSKKARRYHALPGYQFWGVFVGNTAEGLMLLNTVRLSRSLQIASPLVYVDYLATAPWNLPPLATVPRHRGIGKVLLRAAVRQSQSDGFAGRIGLHSLPQAESFYRDVCGMTDLGQDPTEYDLRYFEMTEAQASTFLTQT